MLRAPHLLYAMQAEWYAVEDVVRVVLAWNLRRQLRRSLTTSKMMMLRTTVHRCRSAARSTRAGN